MRNIRHLVLLALVASLLISLSGCGGVAGPGSTSGSSKTPQTATLAVTLAGSGSVVSDVAGINCGPTCSFAFTLGTKVTLTANPANGYQLSAWSGACTGAGPCVIDITANAAVTATFAPVSAPQHQLQVTNNGNGTVVSSPAGINCGATCGASFAAGTQVTLTAQPASGYSLSAWGGACSGAGTCTVTMNSDLSVTATFALNSVGGNSPVSVLTWKYDNSRAGLNPNETKLTPSNVSTSFGMLFKYKVDGLVFAQPLYVPNLSIPGKGTHNVIFVATEHDSVYALDADTSQAPLWKVSFLSTGVTPVQFGTADPSGGRTGLGPEVGITGTPVIDPNTNTLYVSAMTWENNQAVHRLHALDLLTGAEKFGGPKVITATVPGTGSGNDGVGHVTFNSLQQNERAGLLLLNGEVLVTFAAFSDVPPYHGWLFAYNAQTLQLDGVFMATPTGEGAGIWQGGAAPAADSLGNIYLATADGTYDGNNGGPNWGDTVLKLSFSNGNFNVLDYFTPYNQNCLNNDDLDLGAGGPALLPDAYSTRQMLLVPSKEGRFYVVDRNAMGHYRTDNDSQILDWDLINPISCGAGALYADGTTTNRIYGGITFFNGSAYVGAANTTLRRFTIDMNGNLVEASHTSNSFQTRGAATVISANGTSNAILWVLEYATSSHGAFLRAYDATDLSNQLYASAASDIGNGRGLVFAVPVVANGKVYAGSEQYVTVFGLK